MQQGGCFHPALAFSGFMDDFRVYSIDLSSIDLQTDANCTLRTPSFKADTNFKYLTAYLNFDEVRVYTGCAASLQLSALQREVVVT